MPAVFEIFQRQDAQYSWRLKASNHATIATAGEGWATRHEARAAAEEIQAAAPHAEIGDHVRDLEPQLDLGEE